MSVAVRPWKQGRFQVDILYKKPDGTKVRDQKVIEARTEGMARRWGESRENQLRAGTLTVAKEKRQSVMTVSAFAPEFVAGHHTANLAKKSGTVSVEDILRVHIVPFIGDKTLDCITDDVVASLKAKWTTGGYATPDGKRQIRATDAKKTINNRLSVLKSMLETAVAWKAKSGLLAPPCTIRLLKVDNQRPPTFLDHGVYERLVAGARDADPRIHALVLLAGDGGLRRGECLALNQSDVDFVHARMTIRQSIFVHKRKRFIDEVKGLRVKAVPLTPRLLEALKDVRHLRGERMLYRDDGSELTPKVVWMWIRRAEIKAGLPLTGRLHVLRHSFCSHAAMAGVPTRTIQDLARHSSMAATMRYMHLSPSATDEGIEMLARSREAGGRVATRRGQETH